MTDPRSRFPWWVLVGGLVLAAGYLPTLAAPFDFIDDGNLVYPAPAGTTLSGHADRWWDKVRANVEHLGPFRPSLWVHWEVFANTLDADPASWRAMRLGWCAFAAVSMLWLMRELRLPPTAALIAAASGLWNPYRNEIWTSLTLSEGVAMPYALLALVAARKAAHANWAWPWDLLSAGCVLMCLGCKNTFVALVPAQLALRLLPDGLTLRDGLRRGWLAAGFYLLPLTLPAAHFVYFKLNWHPGQYETPGPSFTQAKQFASWMKGAVGLDFLGAGLALTAVALWLGRKHPTPEPAFFATHRAAVVSGSLLVLAGTAVYLPLPMMAARYTMPATWGADVLFAVLLAALMRLPDSLPKRAAWVAVGAGLAAIAVANVGRQERVAAKATMLWELTHELERTAPSGARVMWVGGESSRGELNTEEGIHVAWHLQHRGRGDIRVMLFDTDGNPVKRVELPPPDGLPDFRAVGGPAASEPAPGWEPVHTFEASYRFGKKKYACRLDARAQATGGALFVDPLTAGVMRAGFDDPTADVGTLLKRATANP